MAWYYNWRNRYYGRRYWLQRRRPRKAFRPRRRRRRVRRFKHKLPYLRLKEWQPRTIRKCHIKGLDCLCLFNQSRLGFNSTMYRDSFVPPNAPGGGSFAIAKYTLGNLYDMHKYCSNWWTATNEDLPLCRYLGCRIKCYQSKLVDYIIKYNTSGEAKSNKLTYPSTQPNMLMMSSNKIIIPSRQTHPKRKPYYIIKIPPPTKLENKWYFQKDIYNFPLVTLYTSAASLTETYIRTQADNNNITIYSINTEVIKNHNFKQQIWPYKIEGTTAHYFYQYTGTDTNNLTTSPNELLVADLIPLTNIQQHVDGASFNEMKIAHHTQFTDYKSKFTKYAGNPFMPEHLKHQDTWLISQTGPNTIQNTWTTENTKIKDITHQGTTKMAVTLFNNKIINEYRYNPFKDTGKTTQMYLLKCNSETQGWEPPPELEIQLTGFPLWLNTWGYIDFQQRLGAYSQILENTILVFKNQTTQPKTQGPIVPIDWDYLNGKSPFEDQANPQDINRWYPQVQFQTQSINNICLTGPNTPKLYDKTSDQIVIKYDFLFKWGGDPPKMITVSNPQKQSWFPVPSDEYKTTSLQNPAQSFETLLYSFDERQGHLTNRAVERLKKDWDFTELLSSIAEPPTKLDTVDPLPQDPQETQATEKEKEKILEQLILHRQQQQQLRLGILNLMRQMDL
nr:MAG: ORF1 [TTV-like mini virus]